jgi:hypothetical protein
MNSNAHKGPVLSRTLLAQSIIAELQAEARLERHQVDDDFTRCPEVDPMASAQSRRATAMPVEVH